MPFWWQLTMHQDSESKKWIAISSENGLFIVEAKNSDEAERKIRDEEFLRKDRFWRQTFKFCSLGVRGPHNTEEEAKKDFFEFLKKSKNGNQGSKKNFCHIYY